MTRYSSIFKALHKLAVVTPLVALLAGCAFGSSPDGRTASIPAATPPDSRMEALNEKRHPVITVKLGRDVLVPKRAEQDPLPQDRIGPFELRGETLASALQIVLDDYDVSLAFESPSALQAQISVSNLHGTVEDVVGKMCSLANLYCHFQDGLMTVKNTETFVVDLPPLDSSSGSSDSDSDSSSSSSSDDDSDSEDAFTQIADGLQALTGSTPTVDETTRVMIYTATHRTQKYAEKYFERLRKNTALVVYETHIWEVTLDNNNRTGIDWSLLGNTGNFGIDIQAPGGAPTATGTASPITITPTWTGSNSLTPSTVLSFISEHGAVKTVSQPQITVLSGASATLSVQQTENFVSGVARTQSTTAGVADTVSTTVDTVETGLTMTVSSAWDQATVYGNIDISIDELLSLDSFNPDVNTTIQLPRTTQRSLQTQVRVRPGDAILIGGLVSQKDDMSASGPGFMKPLMATAREVATSNTELVFLLRPRVIAYVPGTEKDTVPTAQAPRRINLVSKSITEEMARRVKEVFSGKKEPVQIAEHVRRTPPKIAPLKVKQGVGQKLKETIDMPITRPTRRPVRQASAEDVINRHNILQEDVILEKMIWLPDIVRNGSRGYIKERLE